MMDIKMSDEFVRNFILSEKPELAKMEADKYVLEDYGHFYLAILYKRGSEVERAIIKPRAFSVNHTTYAPCYGSTIEDVKRASYKALLSTYISIGSLGVLIVFAIVVAIMFN